MADIHRYIIVRESRVAAINSWLQDHPTLDPRGGGDQTFGAVRLALITDPDDGSVVRGRGCLWQLSSEWKGVILDRMANLSWKVNTTDNDNDLSHYGRANWTKRQVLDDVTRKPFAVKVVPVESGP